MTVAAVSENIRSASAKWIVQNDYRTQMEILNSEQVEQDDPGLVRLIRQYYLQPPSVLPYNFTNNKREDYSQGGQSTYIDTILNHVVSEHKKAMIRNFYNTIPHLTSSTKIDQTAMIRNR